jgi:hypothetical protein
MTEERIKVLNMLAEGTISVEQASQLLDVLDGDDEADSRDLEAKVRAKPERNAIPKEPRFGEFTFDQVLRMENEGVEPAFFAKVRQAGLTDLSFEQVLHMASVGVEPEFVLRARGPGMPDLTFDQIMQLADVGVDSGFLVKVREAGLTDLSFDQIVQMVTAGVEPEFFSRLREESSER